MVAKGVMTVAKGVMAKRSKRIKRGVVLAGGLGRRMEPLTFITNKHLLPVYNKPMIYYPINTLVEAGIEEIMIVTGGRQAGEFLEILGDGSAFGLNHIHYTYQKEEKGIADALSLAEHFAQGESIVVILGDNLIEEPIKPFLTKFREQKAGARILLKEVDDASRFGVATIINHKIDSIREKPMDVKTGYAVTGIYMYDSQVFDFIRKLKPSERAELEITDVHKLYLEKDQLEYNILEGFWTDCGTFESLHRASNWVRRLNVEHTEF